MSNFDQMPRASTDSLRCCPESCRPLLEGKRMLKSWHWVVFVVLGGIAHPESPITGGGWLCPSYDTQAQCEAISIGDPVDPKFAIGVDLRRCIQVQADPCQKSSSGGP